MPKRDFQSRLKFPLTADETNDLVRLVAFLESRVASLEALLHVGGENDPIQARIVGVDLEVSPPAYRWVRVFDNENGTVFMPGQIPWRGNEEVTPAYERNGNPYVPVDGSAIVTLTPSEGDESFIFEWSAEKRWAKLTANLGNGTYNGTLQYPAAGGTWTTAGADITLREVNDATDVLLDAVVEVSRGHCSGAPRVEIETTAYGDSNGSVYAQQSLKILDAADGTFTLLFYLPDAFDPPDTMGYVGTETTADIDYDVDAAGLETALNDLTIKLGSFSVTGSGTDLDPFLITFGTMQNYPLLEADETELVSDQEWTFKAGGGGGFANDWGWVQITSNSSAPRHAYSRVYAPSGSDLPATGTVRGNPTINLFDQRPLANGDKVLVHRGPLHNATAQAIRDEGPGTNETWRLLVSNATAGNLTIAYTDLGSNATFTSSAIGFGADAADVEAALLTIPPITTANVTLDQSVATTNNYTLTLTKNANASTWTLHHDFAGSRDWYAQGYPNQTGGSTSNQTDWIGIIINNYNTSAPAYNWTLDLGTLPYPSGNITVNPAVDYADGPPLTPGVKMRAWKGPYTAPTVEFNLLTSNGTDFSYNLSLTQAVLGNYTLVATDVTGGFSNSTIPIDFDGGPSAIEAALLDLPEVANATVTFGGGTFPNTWFYANVTTANANTTAFSANTTGLVGNQMWLIERPAYPAANYTIPGVVHTNSSLTQIMGRGAKTFMGDLYFVENNGTQPYDDSVGGTPPNWNGTLGINYNFQPQQQIGNGNYTGGMNNATFRLSGVRFGGNWITIFDRLGLGFVVERQVNVLQGNLLLMGANSSYLNWNLATPSNIGAGSTRGGLYFYGGIYVGGDDDLYIPGNSSDWNGTAPVSKHEAFDRLAAWAKAVQTALSAASITVPLP